MRKEKLVRIFTKLNIFRADVKTATLVRFVLLVRLEVAVLATSVVKNDINYHTFVTTSKSEYRMCKKKSDCLCICDKVLLID